MINIIKSLSVKIFLFSMAVSLPIILVDQYFKIAGYPEKNGRVMLLGGGHLTSTKQGFRRYQANSRIRHSAVYGKNLAYSYYFETDKNGFRITNKCNRELNQGKLIAIAGDSFTEAQGSTVAWTKSIQEKFCKEGYESVNTSIAGVGVVEMEKALEFAYEVLGARTAIVAIINFDIYRGDVPVFANEKCSTYGSECGKSTTWWHHPENYNNEELVRFAKSKYKYGIGPVSNEFLKTIKSRIKKILGVEVRLNRKEFIKLNAKAMNSISSKYGSNNVTLFILPNKLERNLTNHNEEQRKMLDADLDNFFNLLNRKILIKDLRECPLDESHFIKFDGHPNELGQQLLGSCALNS